MTHAALVRNVANLLKAREAAALTSWHNRQWWRAELWLALVLVLAMLGGLAACWLVVR